MQIANLAPGLYYEPVQPVRADGLLARGDVPLFVGFTRHGPVRQAVRVRSLRETTALFGDPPDAGHLLPALRGFFETGGEAAYVIRLAVGDDPDEGVAGCAFANGWHAAAAFNWRLIDPNTLATGDAGAPAWAAMVAAAIRDGASVPDPGSWGNRLSLSIRRVSLPLIAADPLPGDNRRATLASLAGLEAGGIVAVYQDSASATVALTGVDATLLQVELARPLGAMGLACARPFQLTSVEFRIDVLLDGRLAERFDRVSLVASHSRSLWKALATSRYVTIGAPAGLDPADPAQMLPEGSYDFVGGRDRIRAPSSAAMRDAWLDAIAVGAGVDEAASVAAPDLVLRPPDIVPDVETPAAPLDCCNLAPAPPASLSGSVVDAETGDPLACVTVTAAGEAPRATSDPLGQFNLGPLAEGLFTVRLAKAGYDPAELLMQASEFGAPLPPVALAPLAVPSRLADGDIVLVQQAMATAAGRYKVAIVDPPSPALKANALLTWRARLGDSDRIAFFAPWIVTPDGEAIPPSGHVCGAMAAGEIAAGIARAPANLSLLYATAPSLDIDDATQAGLHGAGVNAIRAFAGRGLRIWGARTLSSDPSWRQLTARRVVDAIERTLEATLQWAVFEGNDVITRRAVAFSIETLLGRLWRGGGLAGASADEAYRIKCDCDNNPEATVAAGQLVVEVAVAPSVPFEFVVFRIAKSLDQFGVGEGR